MDGIIRWNNKLNNVDGCGSISKNWVSKYLAHLVSVSNAGKLLCGHAKRITESEDENADSFYSAW